MIWIDASRIRTLCALIVVALSASCTTVNHNLRNDYVDHVDLSDETAEGTATIQGSSRTMLGLLGEYCWIRSPATAKRVTINAGPVHIIVMCEYHDAVLEDVVMFGAAFRFEALAGHEYETNTKCDSCVQLRDVSTNEVVAESSVTILSGSVRRTPTAEESARDAVAQAETMTLPLDRIAFAQQMLNSLDYDCGEPTGVVDWQTRNAVIDYQFDQELEITGWINDDLVTHLEAQISSR